MQCRRRLALARERRQQRKRRRRRGIRGEGGKGVVSVVNMGSAAVFVALRSPKAVALARVVARAEEAETRRA